MTSLGGLIRVRVERPCGEEGGPPARAAVAALRGVATEAPAADGVKTKPCVFNRVGWNDTETQSGVACRCVVEFVESFGNRLIAWSHPLE